MEPFPSKMVRALAEGMRGGREGCSTLRAHALPRLSLPRHPAHKQRAAVTWRGSVLGLLAGERWRHGARREAWVSQSYCAGEPPKTFRLPACPPSSRLRLSSVRGPWRPDGVQGGARGRRGASLRLAGRGEPVSLCRLDAAAPGTASRARPPALHGGPGAAAREHGARGARAFEAVRPVPALPAPRRPSSAPGSSL